MKAKPILFIICVIIFVGCKQRPPHEYNDDGISFSYPRNWRIKDDKFSDEDYGYMFIEKKGKYSSGHISISWVNKIVDPQELLTSYSSKFIESKSTNSVAFIFIPSVEFIGRDAKGYDYTFEIEGLKHRGVMYSFNTEQRSFTVSMQEVLEDSTENRKGFSMFKETLRIE